MKIGKASGTTVGFGLLVVLLFLLTYATRGPQTLPTRWGKVVPGWRTLSAVPLWVLVVMALFGIMALLLVVANSHPAGAGKKKRVDERKMPWQAWIALFGFFGAFTGLLVWLYRLAQESQGQEITAPLGGRLSGGSLGGWLGAVATDAAPYESPAAAVLGWLIVLSGILLFLAILWRAFTWRVPQEPLIEAASQEEQQEEEMLEAIELSLAEVVAEPDPRRAIEACYHQFLRLLDRLGLSIPCSYTAEESLRAALEHFALPRDAVRVLIFLFEIAEFSQHPITEEDKHRTIAALEQCRAYMASRSEQRRT